MGLFPDNSDTREKLEEEIKKLESLRTGVEKPSVPKVELDLVTYDPPSDDDIRRYAIKSMDLYRTQGIKGIEEKSAAEEKTLNEKRDAYEVERGEKLRELSSAYAKAASDIDNDVLKRGLARSTVATSAKSDLAGEYAGRYSDKSAEYDKAISEIDNQIASVGTKLQDALNDFNLSYAIKLNEKLESLFAERDKKNAEAVEYNNSVKEKQAKLEADRLKTESELYSNALEQQKTENGLDTLSAEARNAMYKSIYEKMDAYLGAMSERDAKLEIRNHALYRTHLSDYYYYKLYNKYGR